MIFSSEASVTAQTLKKSAMNPTQMPPERAALELDETTILGHRLLKSFHKLRLKRHRKQLIAMAEWLVEEEEKYPAEPDD